MKKNNLYTRLCAKLYTKDDGFILIMSLVVIAIMLAISTGISNILIKQLYFSQLSRASNIAYSTADDGLSCATYIDDAYIDPATGIGIFRYDGLVSPQNVLDKVNVSRISRLGTAFPTLPSITLSTIKCANSSIFDTTTNLYTDSDVYTDPQGGTGRSTVFMMRMGLSDGTSRCAEVTVNKTQYYRQIISRGFNTCNIGSKQRVERAVISVYERR